MEPIQEGTETEERMTASGTTGTLNADVTRERTRSSNSKGTSRSSSRLSITSQEELKKATRVFKVSWKIRVGGVVLALSAGMVNAIAFKALARFVSHQTGNLSKVGLNVEADKGDLAGESALLVFSFLVGSLVCGFLIGKNTIHFGLALYDFCLLGVCILLVATTFLADHDVARYLAAGACGLQNGMATIWSGAVVRTTHVTGLLTDVGLIMGRLLSMLLRKRCGKAFDQVDQVEVADDLSKASVLSGLVLGFLLGVVIGAALEQAIDEKAFLFPAAITGLMGLSYSAYRVWHLHQRFFSTEEMEVVDMPEDVLAGAAGRFEDHDPDDMDQAVGEVMLRVQARHTETVKSVSRNAFLLYQAELAHHQEELERQRA